MILYQYLNVIKEMHRISFDTNFHFKTNYI